MDDMNRSKDGSRADNIENNYIGEKDESLSQSCNKQLHPSFPLHDQRDFYNFGKLFFFLLFLIKQNLKI